MNKFLKSIMGLALSLGMVSIHAATFTIHNKTGHKIIIHKYDWKAMPSKDRSPDDWVLNPEETRYFDTSIWTAPNIVWNEELPGGGMGSWFINNTGFSAYSTLSNVFIYTNGRYEIKGGSLGVPDSSGTAAVN
jgi:hypothetical protein